MVDYETVETKEIRYGNRNFLEIAKKKTSEGAVFISISKGWFPTENEKRFKNGIGFPAEPELIDKVIASLQSMKAGLGNGPIKVDEKEGE
ncbi:MAG: hypothetical protein QXP42_00525 [Candidatus Micrarchaeia archaeon]